MPRVNKRGFDSLTCCFVVFVGLLKLPTVFAQSLSSYEEERPKVAVVLAGGGAKGAAPIGVLKALEEMQIPVDYITGTSMGACVWGL